MIVFRVAPTEVPFLWESNDQPEGRWHGHGEGPVHYFADTPDGAWAELLRHEEIQESEDLLGIRATLWAVEIGDSSGVEPKLSHKTFTGGRETYIKCQEEARRLRNTGADKLVVLSAALLPGCARGWCVNSGLQSGPDRNGKVIVLFGKQPNLIGWIAIKEGKPDERLLSYVRYF